MAVPGELELAVSGPDRRGTGRRGLVGGDVARALFYMDVRYEGGTHGVTGVAEPDLRLTDDPSLIVTSGCERLGGVHGHAVGAP